MSPCAISANLGLDLDSGFESLKGGQMGFLLELAIEIIENRESTGKI